MVELNQSLVPTPCLPWRAAKIPPHRQVRKLLHLELENGMRDGRLPPVETFSFMGISLMRLQSATPLAEEAATSAAASAASSASAASAASAAAAAAAVTTTTAAAVTTTTAATA
jgi:hypothetical protein